MAIRPLKPIQPLGVARRSRKKSDRPDYSIDLKAERRRRPRVSIEELSAKGADALKHLSIPKDEKKSGVTKVLDFLDVPRNVIARAIAAATGMDVSKARTGTLAKKVYASDILKHLGVPDGPARSVAGFLGDVALDPLTYYSLGASTGTHVARHLPRLTGTAHKALKAAKATGKIGPELAKAIGPLQASRLEEAFAIQAAKTGGKQFGKKAAQKRMGQLIAENLTNAAGKHSDDALRYFAKYGEKGRTLLRAPFASKGIGAVPFGRKAKNFKAIETALSPGAGGQKSVRVMEKLKKSIARDATASAAKNQQITSIKEAAEAAKDKLDDAQTLHTAEIKAMGNKGVRRIPVRTSELRKAERELRLAQERLARVKARYDEVRKANPKAVKKLTGYKHAQAAVTAAKKRLKEVRKATARITELPPEREAIRTPLQLAKLDAAGAAAKARTQIPKLKAGVKMGAERQAKRINEIKRLATSDYAPAIPKRAMDVSHGVAPTKGAPGIINRLRQAKHEAFGPGQTELRQMGTAIQQQATSGAARTKLNTIADLNNRAGPIMERLVASGKYGDADDVRRAMSRLIETGAHGEYLGKYAPTDELLKWYEGFQKAGFADDPEVQRLLWKYGADMGDMQRLEHATGFAGKPIGGYHHRVYTPEAQAARNVQQGAGKILPGANRGRSKLVEIKMPDGQVIRELDSNKQKIADLLEAGGERTKQQYDISMMEWNRRAQAGKGPEGIVGSGFKGADLFKEDFIDAAGSRAALHERRMAASQLRDLVDQYGVKPPTQAVGHKSAKYSHLVQPKAPSADNPFAQLGIHDQMYPRPVAATIERMTDVWDNPQAIAALTSATDTMLGWWKSQALYHPSYVIRNIFQNFFGGLMAGANPTHVARLSMSPATKTLREALVTANPAALGNGSVTLAGKQTPLSTLYELAQKYHLVGGGRTVQEVGKGGLGSIQAMGHGLRAGAKKAHTAIFRWNALVEDRQRLATWLHFIDKGMSPTDAVMQTLKAMPDLTHLSLWEKNVAARVFPWWRWMRHNGALQLFEHLPQRPAYAAGLPKLKYFVEGFRGKDNVPDELRPMWQQEQIGMQISGDGDGGATWLAKTWFPFEDLYTMGSFVVGEPEDGLRRWVGSMRPEMKFAAEAATGQSIFKQTPLKPIGQAASMSPLAMAQGRTGTALDSLTTIRPMREWGPGGRVSEMPDVQTGLSRLALGGAIQPIDRQRGLVGRYYELDKQQRELRSAMNRALNAGDQGTAQSLYQQWLAIQRQMYQYKFPISREMENTMAMAGVQRPGPPR